MKNTYFKNLPIGYVSSLLLLLVCLLFLSAQTKNSPEPISVPKIEPQSQEKLLGAELYYQQMENYQVRVYLTKYISATAAPIRQFETVALYEREAFMLHSTLQLEQECAAEISPAAIACGQTPGLKKVTYSVLTMLSPMPGGFDITWGQCCLDEALLVNVAADKALDFALSVHLPDPMDGKINSMPYMEGLPAHLFCANEQQVLTLAAKDEDGDQIAYSFSTLFSQEPIAKKGGNLAMPTNPENAVYEMPKLTGRPPFKPMAYKPSFSALRPINGTGCQLDEQSGQLSFETSLSGHYLIGLTLKDFREKQLLSEHQCVWLVEVI